MAPVFGGTIALLDTLTGPEVLTILVAALIVLGPEKLPGVAKQAGVWFQKIRSMGQSLQNEMRDVFDDPSMEPLKELGEFAAQPRRKLAEYARQIAAEDEPTTPDDAAQTELADTAASAGEVGPAGDSPAVETPAGESTAVESPTLESPPFVGEAPPTESSSSPSIGIPLVVPSTDPFDGVPSSLRGDLPTSSDPVSPEATPATENGPS